MSNENDENRPDNTQLEGGRWTTRNGSTYHKMMRDEAWERYSVDDARVDVEAEQELGLLDSDGNYVGFGYADLVVENKYVVDYKTDQMDSWTESTARARGHLYGSKIASYATSPQLDDDAEGHLFMVGSRSEHSHINEIFIHAAAEHGVSVTFCESAEPQAVMDEVEARFMPAEQAVGMPLPEPQLTETVEPSKLPQPTKDYAARRRLDEIKGMLKLDDALTMQSAETFAEEQQSASMFQTHDQAPYATDPDLTTLFFFGMQFGLGKLQDSSAGQYVAAKIEAFQDQRLANGVTVVSPQPSVPEPSVPESSVPEPSPDMPSEPPVQRGLDLDPTPSAEPPTESSRTPDPVPDPEPLPDPEPEPEL